jgi:hypothetical protein
MKKITVYSKISIFIFSFLQLTIHNHDLIKECRQSFENFSFPKSTIQ